MMRGLYFFITYLILFSVCLSIHFHEIDSAPASSADSPPVTEIEIDLKRFDRPCHVTKTHGKQYHCPPLEQCSQVTKTCHCLDSYGRNPFDGGRCIKGGFKQLPNVEYPNIDVKKALTYERRCIPGVQNAEHRCPNEEVCQSVSTSSQIKHEKMKGICKCSHEGKNYRRDVKAGGLCVKISLHKLIRPVSLVNKPPPHLSNTETSNIRVYLRAVSQSIEEGDTIKIIGNASVESPSSDLIDAIQAWIWKPVKLDFLNSGSGMTDPQKQFDEVWKQRSEEFAVSNNERIVWHFNLSLGTKHVKLPQGMYHFSVAPLPKSDKIILPHVVTPEAVIEVTPSTKTQKLVLDTSGPSYAYLPVKQPISFTAIPVLITMDKDGNIVTKENITQNIWIMWKQMKGPSVSMISKPKGSIHLILNELNRVGIYHFLVLARSQRYGNATAEITLLVKRIDNQPPVADAGPDQILVLSTHNYLQLNGSGSHDDNGIAIYQWTRSATSPAAGFIFNNSDQSPILSLGNLIPGHYQFQLTVTDEEGLSSNDTVSVAVLKNFVTERNRIELVLHSNITSLTEEKKKSLIQSMESVLQSIDKSNPISLTAESIEEDELTGDVIVILHPRFKQTFQDLNDTILKTSIDTMKKHWHKTGSINGYSVLRLDSLICMNKCSGHGYCHQKTKQCICDKNWIQSWGSLESNCDWHMAVVTLMVIICMVATLLLTALCWHCAPLCCPCYRKKGFTKSNPIKYGLLNDLEFNDKEANAKQMHTISSKSDENDLSSDDETVMFARPRVP